MDMRKCTRCNSNKLLECFDKNKKGEYLKSCNKCRIKDNLPTPCPKCGKEMAKRNIETHQEIFECLASVFDKTMDYYTWLQKVDKDIIKEYYYKEYIGIVEKNHKVVEYNWISGITGRTHSKVIYDMQRFNELMLSPTAPDIVNRVWVMV